MRRGHTVSKKLVPARFPKVTIICVEGSADICQERTSLTALISFSFVYCHTMTTVSYCTHH